MEIACIGISHKTAPVAIREQVAFSDSQKVKVLNTLKDEGIEEVIILATCNRTEIYMYTQQIEKDLVKAKSKYLLKEGMIPHEYLYIYRGKEAILHLYHVAVGFDSIIVGEDQILGQLKMDYKLAMDIGASGKILNKCFREAITTAKYIKTQKLFSKEPLSVSTMAVMYLKKEMGSLVDKKGLLIGAGKMNELAINHLYKQGVGQLFLANRHSKRTEYLSDKFPHLQMMPYEERYRVLGQVDFVIAATASPHYIMTKDKMPLIEKPLHMMDIAMPRDIEGAIGKMQNIFLYNIDELEVLGRKIKRENLIYMEEVEKLIEEKVNELMEWLDKIYLDPIIEVLRSRCNLIQKDTMNYISGRLVLDAKTEKMIEQLMMHSLKRLIRQPITYLKAIEDKKEQEEVSKIVKNLFDL